MKIKTLLTTIAISLLLFACDKSKNAETFRTANLQNLTDSMSYAVGFNIGRDIGRGFIKPFTEDSIEINLDMVILGIQNGISDDTTTIVLTAEMMDSLT
jgi:hypothetical protein